MIYQNTISPKKVNTSFAKDIAKGLASNPKRLSSKYFYDAKGDVLFQRIMEMPEYYLTNCEFEIFETHKEALRLAFGSRAFDLIELGAGDGTKTKILLEHFLAKNTDFDYVPIDISANVLNHLEADLARRWPDLGVKKMAGEYFQGLQQLAGNHRRKVVLFLGGNIGNMSPIEAENFLSKIANYLSSGDLLLIGFDLKKNPQTILDAYNDPKGITSNFNLNILERINRELGANFQLHQFKHWETYNPLSGATESFLVSTAAQEVYIAALDQSFSFKQWEAIHTELSQKYSMEEIQFLAKKSGFFSVAEFFDENQYFVDVLWEVRD
ncbi:MAG: L-histidine N(alpha)-methyltransferase [Bacteroidota bacterium]